MAAANKTIDHAEIKRWVESHGGHPATVKRTRLKNDVGLIRIDFPGFSGEGSLEPISWDEWFTKFEEQELAFMYQEGKRTNFNKLVRRDPEKPRPSSRRRGPSRTARGGRAAATALAAERSQRAGKASSGLANGRGGGTRSARGGGSGNGVKRQRVRAGQNTPRRGAPRGGKSAMPEAELSELTKAELYELARASGVEQRSSMNKAELIRALGRQRR